MDDKSEDISEAIGAKETARYEKKFIQAQNKLKKCEEAARLSEKELYNLPLGKIASRGRVTLNLLEPWSDDNNENYLLYEGEANTPEIRMDRLERCYGDKKTWELDHLRCMSIFDQAVSTWLREISSMAKERHYEYMKSVESVRSQFEEIEIIILKIKAIDVFEESEKRYLLDKLQKDLKELEIRKPIENKNIEVGRPPRFDKRCRYLFINILVSYLGSINKAVEYAATFPQFEKMTTDTLKREYKKYKNKKA